MSSKTVACVKNRAFQQIRAEFQPDALEIQQQCLPLGARLIQVTLITFIVAGVVWASLAKLDRVVVAEGRLTTSSPRILIQPVDTMVLRSVQVRAGEVVRKGQLLAQLDPTFAQADMDATIGALVSISAQTNRLLVETNLSSNLVFSENENEQTIQQQIYQNNHRDRISQVASLDADIAELFARRVSLTNEQRVSKESVELFLQLTSMRKELYAKQTGSKIQLLDSQHQLLEAQRALNKATDGLAELEQHLLSLQHKRTSMTGDWLTKDTRELLDSQREKYKLTEEIKKKKRAYSMMEFVSPVEAVVLEVTRNASGSILKQGDTLMTLIPLGLPLEAEANVSPQDISHLRKGDVARVKLDSLPFQKHGALSGRVTNIGDDTIEVETSGRKVAVYRLRLTLDATGLKNLPQDFRLIPGMVVTSEIKVGSRSLMSYFIYPILRTLDAGLREP